MSPVATLQFHILNRPFSALAAFGPEDGFARLQSDTARAAGFPLWTPERADHVSGWRGMDRAAAATSIHRQNPHLPAPPADTRYVIAGQQAGLLTGPLYTFLKAVSVISLAKEIERRGGGPVLPLFWMASEDHDVLEVNRVTVAGRLFVQDYAGELKRGAVPQVADIPLSDARDPLLRFLQETLLPPTEFTEWVLETVRAADFSTYATFFRGLMTALFGEWDLRIVDPISLRPLTAPALAELAARWPEVKAALAQGGKTLTAAGFKPPLESPGLFEIVKGKRVAIEFEDRSARTGAGEMNFTELAGEIHRRPADFSPSAALRPVIQDAALPVVVTFGGPTELAYLWQIDPIYRVIGATRSLLRPRISATFVEAKIQRAAEKLGLWPDRLFDARRDLDSAAYLNAATDDERTAAVDRHGKALLDELDALMREKNPNWLEKTRERLAGQIEKIVTRLREDRNEEVRLTKSRLEKIAEAILPGGGAQERIANPFEFLNLYGPNFVRLSLDKLDPLCDAHQVVAISTDSEAE